VNEIITKSEHTLPGCGLIQIKLLSRRQTRGYDNPKLTRRGGPL
jgi:hypothetical protein